MTEDTAVNAQPQLPAYPVTLDVDAPAEVSRLSTLFRIILALPVLVLVGIIVGTAGGGILGGLLLVHWISILIRGRPVGWIFGTIVAIQRFAFRAYTYFFLITDQYPPFEGDWKVSYEVEQPERIQRKQLLIWKTLASIPHVIALVVLWFAVTVCIIISWFAILFTGRFPLGLRGFITGWLRWGARVGAYWMSLRDEFPPFSFSAGAAAAGSGTAVVSGVSGFMVTGGVIGAVIAVVIATSNLEEAEVSYTALIAGEPSTTLEVSKIEITLVGADDSYEFADSLFVPEAGGRFVSFTAEIFNVSRYEELIHDNDFGLKDTAGNGHDPFVVSYGGGVGPYDLEGFAFGLVRVIFDLPRDEAPLSFEFQPEWLQEATFEFID